MSIFIISVPDTTEELDKLDSKVQAFLSDLAAAKAGLRETRKRIVGGDEQRTLAALRKSLISPSENDKLEH